MKKYLKIWRFAIKEQLEYRLNFILSLITMVINDSMFIVIFVIFTAYFTNIGLNLGDFMLVFSFFAFYYSVHRGWFANSARISNIIEQGKLDYYLSFPIDSLKFILFSKTDAGNIGDTLFAIILAIIYQFTYASEPIFILKWLIVAILGSIAILGITILVSSISFLLDKGSEVFGMIEQMLLIFGGYPPKIFESNKFVFAIIATMGLFPLTILPYKILTTEANISQWLLLAGISICLLGLGILAFNRGLRRYKSGNLVLQS